jgi:hypothetical protein
MAGIGDAFPLQGASFLMEKGRSRWAVYAGESKYRISLADQEPVRPTLLGAGVLVRLARSQLGAGVTAIDEPAYLEPTISEDQDAVGRASFYRVFTPWTSAFAEGFGTARGGLGFRAGMSLRSQNGLLNAAVYSFDGQFPLAPVVRPGEEGLELSGSYRPSEFSTIGGNLYWVSEDVLTNRSDLRGYLAFGKSFGSDAPTIHLSYSREELTFDTLEEDTSRIADRYVASISRSSQLQYADLRIEHVANAGDRQPDRSQALGTYQRFFASSSHFDATTVIQREQNGDIGITAEGAVEAPWRVPYYFVVGLGGAFLDRRAVDTGEGVVRIGLSRRILDNGLYGRIEARLPFDVGLPESNLNRETYAFEIGIRYGWRDIEQAGSLFSPILRPSAFGTLEGSVILESVGQGNIPILVNGRRAAVTGSDGRFRAGRIPVGSVSVAIDASSLEPGLAPIGEASQVVVIAPRQVGRADFALARFRAIRGSVVLCENGTLRPLPRVKLILTSPDTSISLETTAAGGFQADGIPPGVYDLIIDPASVGGFVTPGELPKARIDLTEDVLAYVIRLRCKP